MNAKDYVRCQLMQDILQKMDPDERKLYIAGLSQQKQQHNELMDAIHAQDRQIAQIIERTKNQNWLTSFTSDVLANFTSTGILWLGSKLFKRL